MRKPVVAIDGPAGAGKSTVSRMVARKLGLRYVDTGAMYRIVGVVAAERGLSTVDGQVLSRLCDSLDMRFEERGGEIRAFADGRDVSDAIRTAEAGQLASRVSAQREVRERLVAKQQELAREGGVVMEGRDIGTVVCPDAEVKVFLDAAARQRALRRARELEERGERVDLEQMTREIEERDARDRGRAHSPLRPAEDAVVLDTTHRTLAEVVAEVTRLARLSLDP